MVWLLDQAELILTDSGGVRKETFFFGKACVTMHDQTEWVELIDAGANELVGADTDKIIEAATRNIGRRVQDTHQLCEGGRASQRIVDEMTNKA
jgi:UDP-GlcNAc3NAcA epimerase